MKHPALISLLALCALLLGMALAESSQGWAESASAASAGSVPVLRVSEEPETPAEPEAPAARSSGE